MLHNFNIWYLEKLFTNNLKVCNTTLLFVKYESVNDTKGQYFLSILRTSFCTQTQHNYLHICIMMVLQYSLCHKLCHWIMNMTPQRPLLCFQTNKFYCNIWIYLTKILSAFASLMPFIASKLFFGAYATASTVKYPASSIFFTSAALIPFAYNIIPLQNVISHLQRKEFHFIETEITLY